MYKSDGQRDKGSPMTEPNQDPEPSMPLWVAEQPYQDQTFDQQGSSPPPPPFQIQQGDQRQGSCPPPRPFQYGLVPPDVMPAETNWPLMALVCGIFSYAGFGPTLGIPAIIFGVKGRREAREGSGTNQGMATAGLWLGIVNAVATVVAGIYLVLFVGGMLLYGLS
jgi:hypothetical protein